MARRKKNDDRKEAVRRGAMVFALMLFMYSISVDSPITLARTSVSMLGSAVVGMSVGVAPNPDNSVAAQLAQKQAALDAREANLAASSGGSLTGTRMLAAASFVTSVLVLLLVSMNYYMDFRRARKFA